jgi:beta-exotoxin I transport system permease protein
MLRSVFLKTVRDLRRGFVWWSVGLAGMAALQVSVYPSVRGNAALKKLVENYPDALKGFIGFGGELDYVSAPGYLGMELFSLVVPLLLIVAAIGAGSAAVAGEEDRGTLDLLLSLPLSRTRLALEKLAALVAESVALGLVLWLALWLGARAVGMRIGIDKLGAATASAVALAVCFGAIALLVGCATGRRGWAIGASGAAAVAAYLVNSLAPLVHALEPAQKLTPFYHYAAGDPLRAGLAPVHVLVLVAIAVVAAVAAVLTFDRRDLAA